ncbi:MAG: trypsin-like peptidase domain-containing protein [Candidatus Acidiferrales bacterium]
MSPTRQKIVVILSDSLLRGQAQFALQTAGYDVYAVETPHEAVEAIQQSEADLLLMDANLQDGAAREIVAAIRGSSSTEAVRVILLVGAPAQERAWALDLGADDAMSRPLDDAEFLARVRAQLRARRAAHELLEKMRIAEEGQQIAHTAFEALAVTEKMTNDAASLDRGLKLGLVAVFVAVAVMAGIYFLFARSAHKETLLNNATIARLEGGLVHQQDLIAQVRKMRSELAPAQSVAGDSPKDDLQKQAADLKAKMQSAGSSDTLDLQKQLDATNARLQKVEQEDAAAQTLIPVDLQSVCLLHVAVGFRSKDSNQRLRYAGINQKGEPLQDSDGNPILTLGGHGPEVKIDVFGTGFLIGAGGKLLTNRHVAQPWWKSDEMSDITSQGFAAEISSIHAYFPGDSRAFVAEIQRISDDADLATMLVDMQDLKRPMLTIDAASSAAVSGEPIVSMGYATGLAAILARADDQTAQEILTKSGGDVSAVLDALATRSMIRPLVTQGHIGDILSDKIVFDAQTTSGGSGGPLINHQGKVIGVTFAILKGFGGSNFGIPIKFAKSLLGPQAPVAP